MPRRAALLALIASSCLISCSRDSASPAPTPSSAPTPTPSSTSAPTPDTPPHADMLLVPAGPFTMGADKGGEEDEHPAHSVTLPAFYLDKTEVTHEQYDACVAASICKPKSQTVAASFPGSSLPKHPVNGVRWDDAKAYCTWKQKRLPREAEFEKAVRGTDARRYPWGSEPPTPERTVFGRALGPNNGQSTDDVGTHPLGRGPYGHDDLAGNLWEWMDDEYDPFAYARAGAPQGTPGSCFEITVAQDKLRKEGRQGFTGSNPIPSECEHSIRGGAFNFPADGLRSTNRVHHAAHFRIVMLGFRCAKDAP